MDPRSELIGLIRTIAARGWTPATSGNFSLFLEGEPLRFLITPSGACKASLEPQLLLEVNAQGEVLNSDLRPSAETLLHVVIYELLGRAHEWDSDHAARCILHVHTVFNTLVSKSLIGQGKVDCSGLEILKALPGIESHEATVTIPIFRNSQDMRALSNELREHLTLHPHTIGFLLSGHGLYTWGDTPFSAMRHLEALEFLFETLWRETNGNFTHPRS